MFYAGAPFVVKNYAYRNYGFEQPVAEVEQFLAGYQAPTPTQPTASEGR
jgi:4-hydroxyphenylacetate 3-monooxygenase